MSASPDTPDVTGNSTQRPAPPERSNSVPFPSPVEEQRLRGEYMHHFDTQSNVKPDPRRVSVVFVEPYKLGQALRSAYPVFSRPRTTSYSKPHGATECRSFWFSDFLGIHRIEQYAAAITSRTYTAQRVRLVNRWKGDTEAEERERTVPTCYLAETL